MLDSLFGSVSYSVPVTWYVGLSTTGIGISGSATEPGGTYSRVAVTNNKVNFTNAASGSVVNVTAINFPDSGVVSWGTMTDIALWDQPTGGSVWFYDALSTSKIVQANTAVSFVSGAITITLNNT
jgi:hypothetical protein